MTQTSLCSRVDIAPLVAAIKRRHLLSQGQDTPFFFQIGDSFTIGDDAWSGLAIASRDALYLLRETKTRDGLPMPGVSSETNLSMCPRDLLTIDYADIPGAITSDPAWKMLVKHPCQVSVLLRDDARTASLVPFTADIEFQSPYPLIRVRCGKIRPGDAETILRNSGWLPPRLVPIAAAMPARRAHWTPVIVGLCVLMFIAITVAVVQSESLSVLASLALCIPLLGGLLAFLAWYLRPQRTAEGEM